MDAVLCEAAPRPPPTSAGAALPSAPPVVPAGTTSAARDRTVAAAGGRRGLRRELIASALSVAAAATAIGLYLGTSTPPTVSPGRTVTVSATDPSTHVAASATLTPEATGTVVRLTLTDLPASTTCRLVVHADDGDSQTAAGWASGRSTTDTVPASTAVPLADIAGLDVVSSSGQLLVALPQP